MGAWNKGFTKDTNEILRKQAENRTGKKLSEEHIEKLKNRPKEAYKKPQASEYTGTGLCEYGCGQTANYRFKSGKLCCSESYNSCPKKRSNFSELDHSDRTQKSLQTRTETGVTKTSREKAVRTMRENGTYQIISEKNRLAWERCPWNNRGPRGEWTMYKDTNIPYQGSYEYSFLENLEFKHGIDWMICNVSRGPAIWYTDPESLSKRLYISDYIIGNTIYEVKSSYTWNKNGKDLALENLNKAKLSECISKGYTVVLILDKKEIIYENLMD